jgi:hypothetical protein
MRERKIGKDAAQKESRPYHVRLPRFISEEPVGLGDIIKRTTYTLGIKPCGGCERRAAMLNRWFVFSRRSTKPY